MGKEKKSTNSKPLLAAAIMVKNEQKTIKKTILGCYKYVNSIVILDTGSTDKTISIIHNVCKSKNITYYLHEEPFVDFGYSRNRLLHFARPRAQFLILLDANEELRNAEILRPMLMRNTNCDCFAVNIILINDAGMKGFKTVFNRIEIINSEAKLYYKGRIHEHLISDPGVQILENQIFLKTDFHIFQDKEQDTIQLPRFYRDIKILNEECEKDPKDLRTHFYLGITYRNIKDIPNSFKHFQERLRLGKELVEENKKKGIAEFYSDETYMAYIHSLELANVLGKPESEVKQIFLDMWQYVRDFPEMNRAEHFIIFAGYCYNKPQGQLTYDHVFTCFQFAKQACQIPKPTNPKIVIKTNLYDQIRWYLYLCAANILGKVQDSLYNEAQTHIKDLTPEMVKSIPPPSQEDMMEKLRHERAMREEFMKNITKEQEHEIHQVLHQNNMMDLSKNPEMLMRIHHLIQQQQQQKHQDPNYKSYFQEEEIKDEDRVEEIKEEGKEEIKEEGKIEEIKDEERNQQEFFKQLMAQNAA